ncbi:hypothetical protein KJ877_06345 [bacterium]|nr:hypothetical protein [bacterium]MBU1989806.1 hypothetical protein [bacterium]
MNRLNVLLPILTVAVLLNSCSSTDGVSPSQNKAMTDITSVNKKEKKGAMQDALDTWLEKEWTPSVEKDETVKKMNKDKKRDFKIQEYVTKVEIYMKEEKDTNLTTSHSKRLNSLPVIGGRE